MDSGMELWKELDTVLRVYEQNFRNLHWNAKGPDFDDSHKAITTEYYEMLAGTIDDYAEILCMMNITPANYLDAAQRIQTSENKYVIIDPAKLYNRNEIIEFADIMFKDIIMLLTQIIELLDRNEGPSAGIKSELETVLFNYNKQCIYINKRRTIRN